MKILEWILIFCLVCLLNGCDPVDAVDFRVKNSHDEAIEVKFYRYKIDGELPRDTVFLIPAGGKELVFFIDGLSIPRHRYISSDTLAFCSRVEVSAGSQVSSKNFGVVSEWMHVGDENGHSYLLEIQSDDFE